MKKPRKPPYLAAILLAAITLISFCCVLRNGYSGYDDGQYITENPHIRAGLTAKGITWALTSGYAANWHPLTWISHMADVSLYGLRPAGHHATNLILHVLNVLLLFVVLLRLIGHNPQSQVRNPKSEIQNPVAPSPAPPLSPSSVWRCAFVAALFAVHPLHVESVAWIAERKDVLSTFFFLLTILAYVRYVERPGFRRYTLVVLALGLGLMAKPMLVTLPFVLLLLDYWPLSRLNVRWEGEAPAEPGSRPLIHVLKNRSPGPCARPGGAGPNAHKGLDYDAQEVAKSLGGDSARQPRPPDTRSSQPSTINHQPFQGANTQNPKPNTRLVLEKLPLVLLAAGSSVITYVVQHKSGAVGEFAGLPLSSRLSNALVSYVAYIVKMVWPSNLAIFYPHPEGSIPAWQLVGAGLLIIAVTVLTVIASRKGRRYPIVGWLWYLGTLVPVIGIVQVGSQAMADRYTYVPLIGPFIMIAWGIPDLLRTPDTRHPAPNAHTPTLPLALAVIAVLGALTWRQVGVWHDPFTVFGHAAEVTRNNYLAEHDLGLSYAKAGRDEEAVVHYRRSLEMRPTWANSHFNLANALSRLGRISEAIPHYEEASRLSPRDADVHYNLGLAYDGSNRLRDAIVRYRAAISIRPSFAEAHNNLAVALYFAGDYAGAWRHVQECRKYGVNPNPEFIKALSGRRPPTTNH